MLGLTACNGRDGLSVPRLDLEMPCLLLSLHPHRTFHHHVSELGDETAGDQSKGQARVEAASQLAG